MEPSQNGIAAKNRSARLSKDGRWRSFPKTPNLLQYVSTGVYYARVKTRGKLIRRSLDTNTWTTAKLKLVDFLKEQQNPQNLRTAPPLTDALETYKGRLAGHTRLKPRSKEYRLLCIQKLTETWPEFLRLTIADITPDLCIKWAAALRKKLSPQYYNNVTDTLRLILDVAIDSYVESGGKEMRNPMRQVSRARVPSREMKLPERDQFQKIVAAIRNGTSGWSSRAADLVEFLAYSGLRLNTEAQWVMWDDIDWQKGEVIVRGNPETRTKNWEIRRIPILPDMEPLLRRMAFERNGGATGKVLEIDRCPESLARACKAAKASRLRHHDLRHLFATRCIESGVDIPTVARWLGHKDGGALAMKTYGHLRNEHSQAMAKKVKF
jgi:integrase